MAVFGTSAIRSITAALSSGETTARYLAGTSVVSGVRSFSTSAAAMIEASPANLVTPHFFFTRSLSAASTGLYELRCLAT